MEASSQLLNLIATIGHIMTGIGTVVLVILIIKTLAHMRAATKFTEIQTNYKFRPWIGPNGSIREIEGTQEDLRFEITLKNFGDLPAHNVIIRSIVSEKNIMRVQVKSDESSIFNIGPLLPNMEKRYWLFVNRDMFQNAVNSKKTIHSAMYFEYEHLGQRNGYGMISEIAESKNFLHKDMWIDIFGLGQDQNQ